MRACRGLEWVLLAVLLALPMRAGAIDKAGARAAYRRAVQHYNLAEYEDALRDFKDAYRRSEDPTLLFNIGQCERQLDHKAEAIRMYKSYLNNAPEAPNADEVR